MLLRPRGVVIDGNLEFGLNVEVEGGVIAAIRPQTGTADGYILSVALVNAHSHLEYRGLQSKLPIDAGYWEWIRAITAAKMAQDQDAVRADCLLAATENRRTGVSLIGEHNDRPFAGEALSESHIKGIIFQEIITFFERETRFEKLGEVVRKASLNRFFFGQPVVPSPHAYHTVDRETLADIGARGEPLSIHVAETEMESQFTRDGAGPIADFHRQFGIPFEVTGKSVVGSLDDLGLVRKGAQFVHCCAIEPDEAEVLAERKVTVAHCPRSNTALGCPPAPVRELLDAGVAVGLGTDSAASSGPIDYFAEMRSALENSRRRGKPLTAEEVWRMATTMGARSLPGIDLAEWNIAIGSTAPLIAIDLPEANSIEEIIQRATPENVSWIEPSPRA